MRPAAVKFFRTHPQPRINVYRVCSVFPVFFASRPTFPRLSLSPAIPVVSEPRAVFQTRDPFHPFCISPDRNGLEDPGFPPVSPDIPAQRKPAGRRSLSAEENTRLILLTGTHAGRVDRSVASFAETTQETRSLRAVKIAGVSRRPMPARIRSFPANAAACKKPVRAACPDRLFDPGGDSGNRTHDLLNAIQALYQLSYIPWFFQARRANPARPAFSFILLVLRNCSDRAPFLTRAAVDADIRIDHILCVALRNRADRAGVGAGTAGNAILRNAVCHITLPPILLPADCRCGYYNTTFFLRKEEKRAFFRFS